MCAFIQLDLRVHGADASSDISRATQRGRRSGFGPGHVIAFFPSSSVGLGLDGLLCRTSYGCHRLRVRSRHSRAHESLERRAGIRHAKDEGVFTPDDGMFMKRVSVTRCSRDAGQNVLPSDVCTERAACSVCSYQGHCTPLIGTCLFFGPKKQSVNCCCWHLSGSSGVQKCPGQCSRSECLRLIVLVTCTLVRWSSPVCYLFVFLQVGEQVVRPRTRTPSFCVGARVRYPSHAWHPLSRGYECWIAALFLSTLLPGTMTEPRVVFSMILPSSDWPVP